MAKTICRLGLIIMLCSPLPAMAGGDTVAAMLKGYEAAGAGPFDAARGQKMWVEEHMNAKAGKPISCATCHHADLSLAGSHYRTGKRIEPMSPRVNPARLTDAEKVEKWFLRNCKATLGRECTVQEKGDFLVFIQGR